MKRYLIILGILGLLINEQAYGMETEFPVPANRPAVVKKLQSFQNDRNAANRYMEVVQKSRPQFFSTARELYKTLFGVEWAPTGAPTPTPTPAPKPTPTPTPIDFNEVKKQAGAVKTQGQMVVQQAANLPAGQKDELASAIGFPDFATMQNAWSQP